MAATAIALWWDERRAGRCGRAVAAAAALAVVAATGCQVTIDDDEWSEDRERLLDGTVVVDLSDPPSRADLTVPDGRTHVVLQRDDRELFHVTVRFNDGRELTTPARLLGVATGGPGEPVEELVIRRDGLSRGDLRDVLEEAVDEFGADPERVAAVLRSARTVTDGRADLIRNIPTDVAPPDELSVQPVVTASEGRISVNYIVTWAR